MAKRRGRSVNGLLVLNKPAGISSNQALQKAKRLYFAAKAGHTGNLDPLATGVLPLCFGEATKFSQFLLDSDKAYQVTVRFGATTTTGDADGEVLEQRSTAQVNQQTISAFLDQFRGAITQCPPMYSAIKYQGKPLYKWAREGKEIERKRREVTIFSLSLDAFRTEPCEADFTLECSKGTYVRSFAEDLGELLGCGAHVRRLHRIKAGPFTDADMVSLDEIEQLQQDDVYTQMDALLKPVDSGLSDIPTVSLVATSGYYLQRGQAVQVASAPLEGTVRLKLDTGEFLGIGEVLEDGRIAPRRLVVTAAATEH